MSFNRIIEITLLTLVVLSIGNLIVELGGFMAAVKGLI